MRIKYTDSEKEYVSSRYDSEGNIFNICTVNGDSIEYRPTLRLINEFNEDSFRFFLLNNESPACTENSIFRLYFDDKRVGWIFPLQAIYSAEHDYAENPHFLKYAYIVTVHLLKIISDVDSRETPEDFSLESYYDGSKCVLVYDINNCAQIDGFDIDLYTVSLYKYGYSFSGKGNMDAVLPDGVERKNLKLKSISSELKEIPYINLLFKTQFPTAENEIIKFYLYYQIIEVLISLIFEDQFRSHIRILSEDSERLFDIRDELNQLGNEKNRVKMLFCQYAQGIDTQYITDFNTAATSFLLSRGRKTYDQYYENMYAVRCYMVHKLYSVGDDANSLLRNLNNSFLNIIIDVLFKYRTPSS